MLKVILFALLGLFLFWYSLMISVNFVPIKIRTESSINQIEKLIEPRLNEDPKIRKAFHKHKTNILYNEKALRKNSRANNQTAYICVFIFGILSFIKSYKCFRNYRKSRV